MYPLQPCEDFVKKREIRGPSSFYAHNGWNAIHALDVETEGRARRVWREPGDLYFDWRFDRDLKRNMQARLRCNRERRLRGGFEDDIVLNVG